LRRACPPWRKAATGAWNYRVNNSPTGLENAICLNRLAAFAPLKLVVKAASRPYFGVWQ
jgi:hypothetical protein